MKVIKDLEENKKIPHREKVIIKIWIDETLNEVREIIDEEIKDFKEDKSNIEEKYRDVKLTKENQELRIDATLSTLKSIKELLSGENKK